MRKDVHILLTEDRWVVTTGGSEEAFFQNQYDAETFGRRIAREQRSKLFVHNADGVVGKKDNYENQEMSPY